jgi:hypothetical protein
LTIGGRACEVKGRERQDRARMKQGLIDCFADVSSTPTFVGGRLGAPRFMICDKAAGLIGRSS